LDVRLSGSVRANSAAERVTGGTPFSRAGRPPLAAAAGDADRQAPCHADADPHRDVAQQHAYRDAEEESKDDSCRFDAHPYQMPSCIFTSSLAIVRGSHGGFQTIWTSTSLTPGISLSLAYASPRMTGPSGQPGLVSVMVTSTSPLSKLTSYTSPSSTMLMLISGSLTSASFAISSSVVGVAVASVISL